VEWSGFFDSFIHGIDYLFSHFLFTLHLFVKNRLEGSERVFIIAFEV